MPTKPNEQEFYTVKEVAEKLRYSIRTVRRWIRSGELAVLRKGRSIRISHDDLMVFSDKLKNKKK